MNAMGKNNAKNLQTGKTQNDCMWANSTLKSK